MELTRISGYGHVAKRYGLDEAIFLDSIMYWYRQNRANGNNFRENRFWTYNSMAAFAQLFPWWTDKQVRRIISSCKEKGALLTSNFNADGRDRTVWYSPSDELLKLYGDVQSICPNGQMHLTEQADASAQTGGPLPCSYIHVYTPIVPNDTDDTKAVSNGQGKKKTAVWAPELFARFWDAYPRKVAKQRAVAAWNKLRPDAQLTNCILSTLNKQKATEMWQKGVGIPYPATYLNQERWTDEVQPSAQGLPQQRSVVETEEVPTW